MNKSVFKTYKCYVRKLYRSPPPKKKRRSSTSSRGWQENQQSASGEICIHSPLRCRPAASPASRVSRRVWGILFCCSGIRSRLNARSRCAWGGSFATLGAGSKKIKHRFDFLRDDGGGRWTISHAARNRERLR